MRPGRRHGREQIGARSRMRVEWPDGLEIPEKRLVTAMPIVPDRELDRQSISCQPVLFRLCCGDMHMEGARLPLAPLLKLSVFADKGQAHRIPDPDRCATDLDRGKRCGRAKHPEPGELVPG